MSDLTAETVTDEQILELHKEGWQRSDDDVDHLVIICDVAIGSLKSARLGGRKWNRHKARAHCAKLLNTRRVARESGGWLCPWCSAGNTSRVQCQACGSNSGVPRAEAS